MGRARPPVIRASEIGEYVYCSRAWWLRRVAGLEPDAATQERMARGTVLHQRHGRAVFGSRALLLLALVIAVAAALLLLGRG